MAIEPQPLRLIGYWNRDGRHFPDPRKLVRPGWLAPDDLVTLLNYLRAAPMYEFYMGYSWCRFSCEAENRVIGSREFWDGIWVWPEGLVHYVESHQVMLPEEFVHHALTYQVPSSLPSPHWHGRKPGRWAVPSLEFWIDWATKHDAVFRRT